MAPFIRTAILTLALAITAAPAMAQVCGDGLLTPPELCDDGNVVDGDGCSALCLLENLPPNCTDAVASVLDLWPPNHKLVPVTVDGVVDPDGDPVTLVVTAVAQDEPVDDTGDGSTCPDAVGIGTDVVQLRSERRGSGDGRVYAVAFAAQDPFGAACTGTVAVCVRHDQRPGGVCGDGGPLFDSAAGDLLGCGTECEIDACIPDDDDLGDCGLDLPRGVLAGGGVHQAGASRAPRTARGAPPDAGRGHGDASARSRVRRVRRRCARYGRGVRRLRDRRSVSQGVAIQGAGRETGPPHLDALSTR